MQSTQLEELLTIIRYGDDNIHIHSNLTIGFLLETPISGDAITMLTKET